VGYFGGTNDLAVVAGPGSVWNNTNQFYVGYDGYGTRLVVSNGGAVFGGALDTYLGQLLNYGDNSNSALVAGSGSIWSNRANLYVGSGGYGNTLVISNGGVLFNSNAWLGYQVVVNDDSNNIAVVTGTGSIWNNAGTLTIGQGGNNNAFVSNQLFVTSGGRVIASVVDVGSPGSLGNVLRLSNGVVQAASVDIGLLNSITGSGTITGNTINFGTISANINGATLTFANGVKNQGFIGTSGGGIFEVYGLFYNLGTTSFTTNSAIFHGPVLSAQGTTNSWKVASSGPWEQAADWSQGVTPSTTNAAVLITNATSKTVTITASTFTAAPGSVTNFGITVSGPSGSTNTLLVENTPVSSPFVAVQLDISTNASAIVTNATLQVGVLGSGTLTVDGQLQVGPGGLLDTSNGGTMNVGSVSSAAVSITGGGTALSGGVVIGAGFLGSTAVVSGTGSVWNGALVVQSGTLIITNGGAVVGSGEVGGDGGFDVMGIVTGPGSVWIAEGLYVGYVEAENNQLIITNGGAVHITGSSAAVDDFGGANNHLTVSGNGALFDASPADLYIGSDGFDNDSVNIGPGGTVLAFYASLGLGADTTTNFINMTGGSLFVTNVYGNAQLQVYGGALVLNGGTVTVNDLVLETNLALVSFSAGALYSASTQATNGVPFVVGDGVDAANFQLLGGVHSFSHLEIRNAAVLSGCGTVTGNVVIDPGGTVLSDCGTLTFTGIVTNNGTMRAINGSVLETYSNLVNNGTIDIIDGGVTNFHGVFVNHGTVLTASSVHVSQVNPSGQDFVVQIPSVPGHTYQLQYATSLTPANWTDTAAPQSGTGGVLTFIDPGGATNLPARFYRVDCTAP
jgi:T5SS/PEP-CTERM-associated repeat protein